MDYLYVWVVLLSLKATTTTTTTASQCVPPSAPSNSRVTTSGLQAATYTCDAGYILFGSSTIQCQDGKWMGEPPICATNIAYKKPAKLSTTARGSSPGKANNGQVTHLHEGQQCAVTSLEGSPWWLVDLLQPYLIVVVRLATRACCEIPALQNLEIRVGNNTDIQKNRLCAWQPGTVEEGILKEFKCAIATRGRYVAIQAVGVEAVLSLCEVQVFSTEEFAKERCSPEADISTLGIFNQTCYEFRVKDGSSYESARTKCQQISSSSSSSSDLAHSISQVTYNYLASELDRRADDLKADLVWIGLKKDDDFISRTWRWVDDTIVPVGLYNWGRGQPNNYNGKQNCVALDKARTWQWNDIGCELDYLPYICQYAPRSCGSPDKEVNTTIEVTGQTTGGQVTYSCPNDSVVVGNVNRTCLPDGKWSDVAPSCKYINCGQPQEIENGNYTYRHAHRNTFGALVNYNCVHNFSMRGSSERICNDRGVWEPEVAAVCLYSWCSDLTSPAHGKVIIRGRRAGDTAEFTCDMGHQLIGAKTVSCELGGAWSGDAPACAFIDCAVPPDLPHGKVILVNHTTHLGSLAAYRCDRNHYLEGEPLRTCGVSGRWSQVEPSCLVITCPEPEVPDHSYVTGYSFQIGSHVIYHCDPGYRMVLGGVMGAQEVNEEATQVKVMKQEVKSGRKRSYERSCEATGLWSGSVPSCLYTDCGEVTPPAKGTLDYLNTTTTLDSLIYYSCTINHRIVGEETRVCQENSHWSSQAPVCQEVRCGPPPQSLEVTGGQLLSISGNDRRLSTKFARRREHVSRAENFRISTVATYKCTKGYVIHGGSSRHCTKNGTWSGNAPNCTYVDCGLPEKIGNGVYRLLSNTTYFGSQVSYQCGPDYRLDGRIRRHCLSNSTWAGLSPICVEITCPSLTPTLTPALLVHPHGRVKAEGVATYSCVEGRRLVGQAVRNCSGVGTWQASPPRCEWVSCQMPEEVENGRTIRLNETLNYHTIIEVHCLPSHRLLGHFRRVCQENASWSGEKPRCLAGDDNTIYTIGDNSIDKQARDSTTTTTATTTATNTGLYVGLFFGLFLCLLFVAALLLLRRKQRRGGGKMEGGGGGRGGGGGEERPPLPPPNKTPLNDSMTYSNITDPITGNNIYEEVEEEKEEDGGGGGGGGGEEEEEEPNNYYNNNNNNNTYANLPNTATTTPATPPATPPATITHHAQPFYRPTTTITNSRRPNLPPPKPPTAPSLVTINGITIDSSRQ